MTEMRKDRRAPASLKVKYKSATVDDFIEQFGTDVSRGGIFIKTKKPLEAGALLKFEFQLADGSAVLHGVGRVAWRRVEQQARPDLPAGMGIKFFKLSDHSRVVVERIESRYTGNKSRYELSDAAEFASPLSGPPVADSSASPLPGNGRRSLASGSGPLTMPPPPAVSSIPPALADVPARPGPPPPPRVASRTASGNVLPKGMVGSFFAEDPPRKSGSPQSRSRDTSEFLASAFQAGGAGPEVRAAARAQAERARRDPESLELGRELFGDLGEQPQSSPPALAQPVRSPSGAARATSGAGAFAFGSSAPHETPTQRPPAMDSAPDAFSLSTPVPAATLPRSPGGRSARPSLSDRIPSIEQLVDEGDGPEALASRLASQRAARDSGDATAEVALPSPQPSADAEFPATGEQLADGHLPLSLAISVPTVPPSAASASESAGRSKLLLFVALASTLTLGGIAVYIGMQRRGAADSAQPAGQVDQPAEPAAATNPTPAPPSAEPQPSAAEPAEPTAQPSAVVAGPEVPIAIQSKPRGAEVWIDGKSLGATPITVKLPSGVAIDVSVRSAGYASVTRSITPREGAPAESFELAPLPYELVVQSDPAGATVVTSGGRAVSPTPLELGHIEGVVNVSVEKDGFQKSTRAVRLEEFHEANGVMRAEISLSLTPLPAAPPKRRARAATPTPAPSGAPPEPGEPPAPVMQVKPEGESPPAQAAPAQAAPEQAAPEAKAKPPEPEKPVPAEKPAAAPEPEAPSN